MVSRRGTGACWFPRLRLMSPASNVETNFHDLRTRSLFRRCLGSPASRSSSTSGYRRRSTRLSRRSQRRSVTPPFDYRRRLRLPLIEHSLPSHGSQIIEGRSFVQTSSSVAPFPHSSDYWYIGTRTANWSSKYTINYLRKQEQVPPSSAVSIVKAKLIIGPSVGGSGGGAWGAAVDAGKAASIHSAEALRLLWWCVG